MCEGASTRVLLLDSIDERGIVFCRSYFDSEASLEVQPPSAVLGQRQYAAATMLHDILLLLYEDDDGARRKIILFDGARR